MNNAKKCHNTFIYRVLYMIYCNICELCRNAIIIYIIKCRIFHRDEIPLRNDRKVCMLIGRAENFEYITVKRHAHV